MATEPRPVPNAPKGHRDRFPGGNGCAVAGKTPPGHRCQGGGRGSTRAGAEEPRADPARSRERGEVKGAAPSEIGSPAEDGGFTEVGVNIESGGPAKSGDLVEGGGRAESGGPRQDPVASPATPERPRESFISLIARAILASPGERLLLGDIYAWIMGSCPAYRNQEHSWRNCVRHNLSLHECFVKAGRSESGRGFYWALHPACRAEFARGDFTRRRARRHLRSRGSVDAAWTSPQPEPHCPRAPPGAFLGAGPPRVSCVRASELSCLAGGPPIVGCFGSAPSIACLGAVPPVACMSSTPTPLGCAGGGHPPLGCSAAYVSHWVARGCAAQAWPVGRPWPPCTWASPGPAFWPSTSLPGAHKLWPMVGEQDIAPRPAWVQAGQGPRGATAGAAYSLPAMGCERLGQWGFGCGEPWYGR